MTAVWASVVLPAPVPPGRTVVAVRLMSPILPPPIQCLNAVRTVQSVACLEEADHTVGFILQLSNFTKEWRFHLPQLMRDVQVC